jgi:hypothetical protein
MNSFLDSVEGSARMARDEHNAEMDRLSNLTRVLEDKNENLKREVLHLESLTKGEYWSWQGDGDDNPASITCQIIISPQHLRDLIIKGEEMEAERDGAVAALVASDAELGYLRDHMMFTGDRAPILPGVTIFYMGWSDNQYVIEEDVIGVVGMSGSELRATTVRGRTIEGPGVWSTREGAELCLADFHGEQADLLRQRVKTKIENEGEQDGEEKPVDQLPEVPAP